LWGARLKVPGKKKKKEGMKSLEEGEVIRHSEGRGKMGSHKTASRNEEGGEGGKVDGAG